MADDPCPTVPQMPGQWLGAFIGLVFIVGSFVMFTIVLLGFTKIEWKDIALVIVGALLNQCSVILGKWYTASQSSDHKTDIMADTAKTALANATETAKTLAATEAVEKK